MAQAKGGTAGSSSTSGKSTSNNSKSNARASANSNAKGDARGPSSSANTSSNAKSSSMGNALSAGKDNSSRNTGGVMGGLMSSVADARAARSNKPSGTQSALQGAVNQAFGRVSPGKAYGNDTVGTVDNRVGAMNTPEARDKAASQTKAFDTGYRNQANRGMTESAFGMVGTPGAMMGKAVGAISSMNGYTDGSDEANAAQRGAALAKDTGLSSGTRGLGSLAAGVLGGPIGSALASLALGGASMAMQRSYHPSAFAGQTPVDAGPTSQTANGQVVGTASGMGNALSGQSSIGSGNGSQDIYGGAVAAVPFDMASDYSNAYNSYRNLNLGSII